MSSDLIASDGIAGRSAAPGDAAPPAAGAADADTNGAEPDAVACTVDLDATGRSVGHFIVPWSRNESGWGNLLTPLAVLGGHRPGKTVLLTGGNHGDEFEGPTALRRLIHELDPEEMAGRVIVVPGLNQAALKAGQRLSPIDGGNLNRSFPGDPRGTPTQRVADFVYRELVSRADVVLDLHSGGRSMAFAPMVATHDLADPDQAAETGRYLRAFGTPLVVAVSEPDGIGLLDTAVEQLGKIFLTTEIDGGASISAAATAIAHRGIVNTLRVAGILPGEPVVEGPPDFVRMIDGGSALATVGGLLEPIVDPGAPVQAGDLVARIHHLDDLAMAPRPVISPATGIVLLRHSSGLIEAGDPVVSVGVPGPPPWAGDRPPQHREEI